MLRTTLFVLGISLLLFGCGPHLNADQQTEPEPPSSVAAADLSHALPLETTRELAQTRKALKMNLTNALSPLENIQELGPNTTTKACRFNAENWCVSGMIKELVIDSEDDQRFVIATETSGAWVSEDAGETWQTIDSDWPGLKLNWVVQSQENLDIFYFGGQGPGLLTWDKTSDLGLREWVGTINGEPASTFDIVRTIKLDPANPSLHYLTTAHRIYKFDGSGYTEVDFDPSDDQLYSNWAGDLEILPGGNLIVHHGDFIRTLRPDGSTTILPTETFLSGGQIAYSPSDPNIVYNFTIEPRSMIMQRSRDGGISWEQIALTSLMANARNQSHAQTLEIYPYSEGKEMIIFGSVDLHMAIIEEAHSSTPQFKTMYCAHGDFHGSLPHKDKMYVYDDGGLFAIQKSALDNYYDIFNYVQLRAETPSISLGLTTLQAVEVKYHEASGRLAIGFWHNGSFIRETNGEYAWVSGGDGFDAAFHPENDDIAYTSAQNNALHRYHIKDRVRTRISSALPKGSLKTKIFTHPDFPKDLFYLDDGIRMIANADECSDNACTQTLTFNLQQPLGMSLAAEESESHLYVFNIDSIIRLAGPTDSVGTLLFDEQRISLGTGMGAFSIADINVRRENGEEIIYVLGANAKLSLLKLDSRGNLLLQHDITLQEGLLAEKLFVNPHNPEEFLIGTSGGIFVGQIGYEFPIPDLSLPAVQIYDWDYNQADNILYIATYGRGIWQANFKTNTNGDASLFAGEIAVHPNPAIDQINISSTLSETILLMDIKGNVLEQYEVDTRRVQYESISHLPAGMYLLLGQESKSLKKLIKY